MFTKQNKTLTFKNDKCFGGKHSKERVTLMVCSYLTGTEKQKLLIIGKSKNPREEDILKALSVVTSKKWFKTTRNVPNEIFLKLNEIETFYKKSTIYKNNKQTKVTDYFF